MVLVRAEDDAQAEDRVQQSLRTRKLPALPVHPAGGLQRVRALAADFAKDNLGLQYDVYRSLAAELQLIIHVHLC